MKGVNSNGDRGLRSSRVALDHHAKAPGTVAVPACYSFCLAGSPGVRDGRETNDESLFKPSAVTPVCSGCGAGRGDVFLGLPPSKGPPSDSSRSSKLPIWASSRRLT